MGFFDDIYIPPHVLPAPSALYVGELAALCSPGSDYQEQAWFWLLDPASDAHRTDPLLSAPEERMYLDVGETIRFAIESDQFFDVERGPVYGESKPGDAANPAGAVPGEAGTKGAVSQSAYRIIGTIAGQGLGLVSWWAGAEQVPVGEEQ